MKYRLIEQTRLSTGQLMYIEKQGRKYSFVLCSSLLREPPDMLRGLTKADAYDAYRIHLKADVLELED